MQQIWKILGLIETNQIFLSKTETTQISWTNKIYSINNDKKTVGTNSEKKLKNIVQQHCRSNNLDCSENKMIEQQRKSDLRAEWPQANQGNLLISRMSSTVGD